MRNKKQEWIDEHPITVKVMDKFIDFAWFFVKFSICMVIWLILRG